mgnify:CR=1 FL=1
MARVSTYLNFPGNTEEAFEFYRAAFGTEYLQPLQRMGDVPGQGDQLPEHERNMVMHVELPILGGHVLMGTDALESMGHQQRIGNNTTIQLQPDSRADADRLYSMLAEGGTDTTGMQDMPWGAYWGCCLDRFGIRWMINFTNPAS